MLFELHDPGSAALAPVGLGHSHRLGDKLSTIALVDTCFTVSIDLALVVLIDAGTCCQAFVDGVVRASKFAVDLRLSGSMLLLLPKIVQG
jgi:hypothetical protein